MSNALSVKVVVPNECMKLFATPGEVGFKLWRRSWEFLHESYEDSPCQRSVS
jgi:hypothetical protein